MVTVRKAAQLVIGATVDRFVTILSRIVPSDSALRPSLRIVLRRLPTSRPREPVARLVAEFAHLYSEPFFIQVGANDGTKNDYLQDYVLRRAWKGIMVEPIPYVFAKLSQRYETNPNLILVNAAVADHNGTAELYYLPKDDDPRLPPWYDQLASFRKEVILKHAEWIPDIDSRVTSMDVDTLTFSTLCEIQDVRQLDLVHVDTEGYDFEIVKQINLEKYKPTLILYEHYHLTDEDRQACELLLAGQGYRSISNLMDTVCIRDDPEDRRTRRMLRLLATYW